jgi:hypothetical protein
MESDLSARLAIGTAARLTGEAKTGTEYVGLQI